MKNTSESSAKRNLQQNARLHKLLADQNIDSERKKDYVAGFTNGRTESSSEMTVAECESLITHLVRKGQAAGNAVGQFEKNDSCNQQRRKILSFCHEMGMHKAGKIDMIKVTTFIIEKGYLKKPLNDYTEKEIPKLVTQVQTIRDSQIKKLYDERR